MRFVGSGGGGAAVRVAAVRRRLGLCLAVAAVVCVPFLTVVSQAGAAWPTTPFTPSDQQGQCNEQYDITGPLQFGYVIAFSCEVAVPSTMQYTTFTPVPAICGGNRCAGTFGTGTNGVMNITVSAYGVPLVSGYTTCTATGAIWFGSNYSGYTTGGADLAACTGPVSPWSGLTNTPPAAFTSSDHLYGYEVINARTIGAATGGYYPEAVRGTFTMTPDTYSGASSAYYVPPSSILDPAGVSCSVGSDDPVIQGLTMFDMNTASGSSDSLSYFMDGSVTPPNYFTCHNGNFAYPAYPSITYTGGTTTPNDGPCTLNGFQGDGSSTPATANQSSTYTFDWSGPTQYIAVDPGVGDTPTQTFQGQTFGTNAEFANTATTGSPTGISVTFNKGELIDPALWCYDAGTWYSWGYAESAATVSATCLQAAACTPVPASEVCVNQAATGISLYNPLSWVGAGWDIGVCELQVLFVPTSAAWTPFTNDVSSRPPYTWIADAFSGVSTLTAGMTSGLSSGVCSAPSISPFSNSGSGSSTPLLHVGSGFSSFTITLPAPSALGCTGTDDTTVGNLFGFRSALRAIMLLGVLLLALALGWRMMPWSKDGDGFHIVESAGGTLFSTLKDVGYSDLDIERQMSDDREEW